MIVKQVSAFLENKAGRLRELADVLAENGIDISALSLADTEEYGVLRMIVNDPEKAVSVLKASGVFCSVTDTLAVAIDDKPGGFAKALAIFTERGVDVKYMYACLSRSAEKALMIVSVDDPAAADRLLVGTEEGRVSPEEIFRI